MNNNPQEFDLQVANDGDGSVVFLRGDLDFASAPDLRLCLRDLAEEHVTLDFSEVTFMDSTGIGVVVDAYQRSLRAGGAIMICGVQPGQLRLFELMGLLNCVNLDGDSTTSNGEVPHELLDAARQELEYPADETDEG